MASRSGSRKVQSAVRWPDDQLIGEESEDLDPWDDYQHESRRLELELFIAREIPEDWMPWASALRWDFPPTRPLPDSPIRLRVGGDAPARSLAELIDAGRRGLGLDLFLPADFDLSALAPVLPDLGYLTVAAAGTVSGWEALVEARCLVQLIVRCDVSGHVPSVALPELRRVIGPGDLLELACAAPGLVELQVDLASKPWPAGLALDGPVEYLEIAHALKLTEPPPLIHPEALRTLRIYNARELDLRMLSSEVNLEWLEIFRTKVLRGADVIARMRRLQRLGLESVASIPGAEALSAATARETNARHSDPVAVAALKR